LLISGNSIGSILTKTSFLMSSLLDPENIA
jgi:hypothetical protein